MTRYYDLVVAGAGPAGAMAAQVAARAGLKVLLLDKSPFPRRKTCGGLLSYKSLTSLPTQLPAGVVDRPIYGFRLVSPSGHQVENRWAEPIGITMRRELFDQYLVEEATKAGAHFWPTTALLNITPLDGNYNVTTGRGSCLAPVVIGADGFYSRVAQVSGIRQRWRSWETGLAISLIPTCSPRQVEQLTGGGDIISFYSLPLPASWGWVFPLQKGFNLGIGAPTLVAKGIRPTLTKFLAGIKGEYGLELSVAKARAWYLPAGGFKRTLAKDGVLLVGDAAGLVDPFSGEGIFWALRSGTLAATLTVNYLQGTLRRPLAQTYQYLCHRDSLVEFRLSFLSTFLAGYKGTLFHNFFAANPNALDIFPTIMSEPHGYQRAWERLIPNLPLWLGRMAARY